MLIKKYYENTIQSTDIALSDYITIGKTDRWWDDDNVVFYSSEWTKVFNVNVGLIKIFDKQVGLFYLAQCQ